MAYFHLPYTTDILFPFIYLKYDHLYIYMACIYLLLSVPPKMTANNEAIIINVCIAAECIAAVHQEFIIVF